VATGAAGDDDHDHRATGDDDHHDRAAGDDDHDDGAAAASAAPGQRAAEAEGAGAPHGGVERPGRPRLRWKPSPTSSGWNWRAAGVRFNLSFYPADCCHWGVYEAAKSVIWVGPTAFDDPGRLRYVVLHELAHAWQYRQNRFAQIITRLRHLGVQHIGRPWRRGPTACQRVGGRPAATTGAARPPPGPWPPPVQRRLALTIATTAVPTSTPR